MNPGQNPQMPQGMPNSGMMRPRASMMRKLVTVIVVLVVIVVLGYIFRDKLTHKQDANLSGYQALFLTNGQVYFGKLSRTDSDYVKLTDIYYLQVNQQLQPTGAGTAPAANDQAQPQLSLVKLGNELHGPTDLMLVNRSQVLFFEDLKNDGKVAQAIQAYKTGANK